jgi:hypothetical protein
MKLINAELVCLHGGEAKGSTLKGSVSTHLIVQDVCG